LCEMIVEEIYDCFSDTESVDFEFDAEVILDDWQFSRRDFNTFSFINYKVKSDDLQGRYQGSVKLFVDTLIHVYTSNQYVTAVRLKANLVPVNDKSRDIEYNRMIRFEIDSKIPTDQFRDTLIKFISENDAPTWTKQDSDEGSDTVTDKSVIYDLREFELIVNRPQISPHLVTSVCGEKEIHPGVFVKEISTHSGIAYGVKDCLIQCLNEQLGRRYDPEDVRRAIWPSANDTDLFMKQISSKRHIITVCRYYNTKIILTDILENKKLIFTDRNLVFENEVSLIKVGSMIGILERIDSSVAKDYTRQYICFDVETVGVEQRVYAFSIMSDFGDLTVCDTDYDFVEMKLAHELIRICNSQADNDSRVCYSWNGSRFDNWIALKLIKKYFKRQVWIKGTIINSANELLVFTIEMNNKRLIFKDPKKLFSVPLNDAADLFNIGCLKESMDHNLIEKHYYENTLYDYIESNRDKLISYVRQDTKMLSKIVEHIMSIYSKDNVDSIKVLTRSVASTYIWMRSLGADINLLKSVTIEPYVKIAGIRYSDLISEAIGGRTQCVKQGEFDGVTVIDVNSMYPFVCAENYYPCGEIIETNEYVPDKLGFYEVEVSDQISPNVVPFRKDGSVYDWNYKGSFVKWITSVDLEQLNKYKVIRGFYWTEKTRKYYDKFMTDKYIQRKGVDRSSPMNMHIKLLMNSVTGAIFQHGFREMVHIGAKSDIESLSKKYADIIDIIGIQDLNSEENIVTFKPKKLDPNDSKIKAQKEFCRGAITNKPWILTAFTYSYARKLLRDKWIQLEKDGCEVLYCDTDSLAFINHRDYPIESSKELGGWKVECRNKRAVFYKSKIYGIRNYGENMSNQIVDKIRVKGLGRYDYIINKPLSSITYQEKAELYREAVNNSRTVEYEDLRDLLNGKPIWTINFYMRRKLAEGVEKVYTIKQTK